MSRIHFHGILVLDKPAGWTSHDVVGWTRRWLGQKKVGHAGTLDPAATGVLPVVVGDATRFVEYLAEASKTYLAEITFGIETDSVDVDGVVTAQPREVVLGRDQIEAALHGFRGIVEQRPPMHSAIKVDGRRLYQLARRGETIDVPARTVTISALDLVELDGPTVSVTVTCSKGTYIRALARDLGEALGTGAYLSNLVRLRTGPFTLCESWTVPELEEHVAADVWPLVAARPDAALDDLDALVLGTEEADDWRHGREISVEAGPAMGLVRVYRNDGGFLGIGRPSEGGASWRPVKVLHEAA